MNVNNTESRKPSLTVNAISNWIVLALNIVVALYMTPVILKFLGKEGYGIWTIILSVVGYYGILDMGVRSAITRYVAYYAGKKDYNSLNKTASTAMGLFITIGCVILSLSFFIAEPLSIFFKIKTVNIESFNYVIIILGLVTALSFPNNVLISILVAHEKFVTFNIIRIFIIILRTSLTLLFLWKGYDLKGIALSYLSAGIVNFALCVTAYKLLIKNVTIHIRHIEKSTFNKLITFGMMTFIITIADQLRFNLDSFVIGKMIDIPSVAVYRIAALIVQYMGYIVIAGTSVLTPRFASIYAKGDETKLKNIFLSSMLFSSILAFGVCMMAIIFGGSFVQFWVGNEYYDAVPVLWILAAAFAFDLSQNPSIGLIYSMNKHRYYALIISMEAVFNVILSIILAPSYGIIGVALGTCIPMIVIKIFIQPIYVVKLLNISIIDYIKPMTIPLLASICVLVSAWNIGIVSEWFNYKFVEAIFVSSIFGLLYIVIIVIFCFSQIRSIWKTIIKQIPE